MSHPTPRTYEPVAPQNVAFLGLGVMGYPMAGHLARAGHSVTVYNRTASKSIAWCADYASAGGKNHAQSPREAARGASLVFCCVGNDDDVRAVTLGADGAFAGMEPGAVFVDHTTASAEVARELHSAARTLGLSFVDAPVSGGEAGAQNGQLTVMCGGDQAAFDAAQPVHPRPRVTVVSTGDELVAPGSTLAHGQIVDSNHVMLRALVEAAGAEVAAGVHLRDEVEAVRALVDAPPGSPDLVITSGGVSMGVYDTVKEVLSADGGVEFVKVAMRPGMPQGSGLLGAHRTPVITLPGNPVSSFASFHVFVLPVLRRLAGLDPDDDGSFEAEASVGWPTVAGKVELTRVTERAGRISPSGGQGSHVLGALAAATALAVVPADVEHVAAGSVVRCLPLLGQDRPRD